jgi:phosphoribosylamine--glycine ligase
VKILVVGGGAREHALAWKLSRERSVTGVLCAPGNPGIAAVARCVPADSGNPAELLTIARRERVDLTVVGPEAPLSRGIVDVFDADHQPIVGPSAAAAALESSKAFAKHFMARHRVPTARFLICDSPESALAGIAGGEFGYPVVIKADGLAAGKGVVIAEDRAAADAAIRDAMVDRRFGAAGERIVLEEFLVGEEASYFLLADGAAFMPLSSAQDHKRIFDDDRGPNTGGMGAFAPSPLVTTDVERRVIDDIVRPVLDGMQQEGRPYRGFLYVGLMLTGDGPKVIEFNVRFGDPEAQVVFPMLDEDLSWLLGAAATGVLPSRPVRFRREPHVGVVLAAGGYPGAIETGKVVTGLDAAERVAGALVFHAGTARRDQRIVTSGGRVVTVVGRGATYRDAIDVAYSAASHIRFDGMQLRTDIGRKALNGADPVTKTEMGSDPI